MMLGEIVEINDECRAEGEQDERSEKGLGTVRMNSSQDAAQRWDDKRMWKNQ